MTTLSPPVSIDIGVQGMRCASCVARLEQALAKVPGVADVAVNLATESVRINWQGEAAPDAAVLADSATPPMQAVPPQILRAIRTLGYTPKPMPDTVAPEQAEYVMGIRKDFLPVLLGLVLSAPLVLPMLLMPWMGAERAHMLLPVWVQAVLGTLVQFTLGLRFYQGAWHAIKQRNGNMELLVALGTTAAWGMSMWLWLGTGMATHEAGHDAGAPAVYFESAAVVITLVQLGKWLELRARRQTVSAIAALQALRPDVAHWLPANNANDANNADERDVPVAELLVGDMVRIKPGERVPADGVVTQGHSQIDASLLTGEPLPVDVSVGDKLTGGSLNGNGVLHMQVSATASAGVLAQIIRLVQDAQAAKPPIQQLVDKVAAVFVPAVLLIAAATLGGWLLVGLAPEQAVLRAVAVLVIACPCALGLATPVAIMVGTGVAARHGILIKNSVALELAQRIQTVAFDKTGTLTQGQPALAALWQSDADSALGSAPAQPAARLPALALAAALQQGSEHPLAHAVLQAQAQAQAQGVNTQADAQAGNQTGNQADAASPGQPLATQVQAVPGCGIAGSIGGQGYALGSIRWAQSLQASTPAGLQAFLQQWGEQGATVSVLMAIDGDLHGNLPQAQDGATFAATQARVVAAFAFTDTIKPESATAVAQLHALGLQTVLISGDNRAAAETLGRQLGLRPEQGEVLAEVLPQGKAQAIAQLQGTAQGSTQGTAQGTAQADAQSAAQGKTRVVCMVGDGINDAPALAAADVGMAMANPQGGTDVALHAADITLMRGDVRLVAASIDISRRTVQKIRQNLFWAFAYNVVGIPLAAFGLLSPMVAGAAMALSSVTIVSNALLLRRWRPV